MALMCCKGHHWCLPRRRKKKSGVSLAWATFWLQDTSDTLHAQDERSKERPSCATQAGSMASTNQGKSLLLAGGHGDVRSRRIELTHQDPLLKTHNSVRSISPPEGRDRDMTWAGEGCGATRGGEDQSRYRHEHKHKHEHEHITSTARARALS